MTMLLRLLVPVVLALQATGGTNAPTTPVPTDGGRAIAGRPPVGPLRRTDPRIYDVAFGVTLFTELPPTDASLRAVINVTDAPFVLPVILRSTYSKIDPGSFVGQIWGDGFEVRGAGQNMRIEHEKPHGMSFVVLPIARFGGQVLKLQIRYRTQVWSSAIDDAAASRIAWPQQWPDECRDALGPEAFIESADPRFKQFVDQVSEGKLRAAPVYLAAKDLVRRTIPRIRVSSSGNARGAGGVLLGMQVNGAAAAMTSGVGTAHDLVCACVAVLRAAGIPARPVIGTDRDELERISGGFVSWGEFYLPDAGWVPFDPNQLRSTNLPMRNIRDSWQWFGTMKELNSRIPFAYTFVPPASLISHGNPAVYGWDPRPRGAPASTRQYIHINTTSRGSGKDDAS